MSSQLLKIVNKLKGARSEWIDKTSVEASINFQDVTGSSWGLVLLDRQVASLRKCEDDCNLLLRFF